MFYESPDEIKALRQKLGYSRREMGLHLFDLPPKHAYNNVYRLEEGIIQPSAAVRRSLMRIEKQYLGD